MGRECMRDEQLKRVLDQIDISECEEIIEDYIFYCEKAIRLRCYHGDSSFHYITDRNEFLIIAERGEKQAIILRCGEVDLHWYVYRKWRNKGVLSNALRTGIIRRLWPENREITCCYNYNDNRREKFSMTKHLADIAGLVLKDER